MQLAVAAVPVASLPMPCDVMDFLSHSALLQDDLAMLILTAAIKEPLPVGALVEAWKALPAHYSGSHLRSAILTAVAVADGGPHGAQLESLYRKGAHFGLITIASLLGIIKKKEVKRDPGRRIRLAAAAAGSARAEREYRLGRTLNVYVVLDDEASKCDQFLEATRAEERCLATPIDDAGASTPSALEDLIDYGTRRIEAALRRIGTKSGALPFSATDASGHCIDFLRMKLVAGRLLQQNLHVECTDWSTVSKESLQSMSGDAEENLKEIPDTWQASQISCFFTGRADWGLFASVYPWLWGEVADKQSTEEDRARALALVKSKDFLRVLQVFRQTQGIAPHPAVAYRILEGGEVAQVGRCRNKASAKPRASTPRSGKKRRM